VKESVNYAGWRLLVVLMIMNTTTPSVTNHCWMEGIGLWNCGLLLWLVWASKSSMYYILFWLGFQFENNSNSVCLLGTPFQHSHLFCF